MPEIASRAHLERILPVIDEALQRADLSLDDIDAVAVANTPGLAGSLLVGLVAAKALCVALGKPLVAVNHLQAHIYACRLAAGADDVFPCVGLIVSGGHTSLYRCQGPLDFELLGGTIDDAAGEAFDKVAAMLGLPYPGGPSIQKAADGGNPRAYRPAAVVPRRGRPPRFQLQRAEDGRALPHCRARPARLSQVALEPQQVADLAASFQEAVVDCLVDKAFAGAAADGPAARSASAAAWRPMPGFAQRLEEEAAARGRRSLHIAPLRLCTDNAVMGAIAVERYKAGLVEELDLDVYPGLVRR